MPISEEGNKNLIELLKVVNLAIIGLSAALISNVVLFTSSLRRNDLEELKRVQSLIPQFTEDSRNAFLTKLATQHGAGAESFYRCFTENPQNRSEQLSLTFFIPSFFVSGENLYVNLSRTRFSELHSVKQFGDWWNDFNRSSVIFIPHFPPKIFISWGFPEYSRQEIQTELKRLDVRPYTSLACISGPLPDQPVQKIEFTVPRATTGTAASVDTTRDATGTLEVQFTVNRVEFRFADLFQGAVQKASEKFTGIFAKDFPALSSLEESILLMTYSC
jgi:hypothetical protein